MNSKLIRFYVVAFFAIGISVNKAEAQPPCFFDCVSPNVTLTNGGILSTSGIQNTGGPGAFQTTGPYCILVEGGTLVVDVNWNLDGVCVALAYGAKIEVTPNIALDMEGGGIYDPTGGILHGGIVGQSGSSVFLDGVRIDGADKAISGNGASTVVVENCEMWDSQQALSCTSCGSVSFNNNNCFAMGLGVSTNLTPNVTVTGNFISGVSNGAGLVNIAYANNANISNNDINAAGFGTVTGISALSIGTATINGNTINVNGCKYGMWVQNLQNLTMSGNNLFFTYHPSQGQIARGVLVISCPAININNNVINSIFTGPAASPGISGSLIQNLNTKGIELSASSGSVINNTISNVNIGVQFSSTCGLTESFRQNKFNGTMDVGLFIPQGVSIGDQTCALNTWNGTFNAHGARNETGNPADSEFFVDEDDFFFGGPQMPPNVFPLQFWFWDSNDEACNMFTGEGGGESERSSGKQGNNLPQASEGVISPNPVNGLLQVSIPSFEETCSIELRDLAGKLVHKSNVASGQTLTELDVSSIESGLYLLNVHSGNFRHTEKVVIAR